MMQKKVTSTHFNRCRVFDFLHRRQRGWRCHRNWWIEDHGRTVTKTDMTDFEKQDEECRCCHCMHSCNAELQRIHFFFLEWAWPGDRHLYDLDHPSLMVMVRSMHTSRASPRQDRRQSCCRCDVVRRILCDRNDNIAVTMNKFGGGRVYLASGTFVGFSMLSCEQDYGPSSSLGQDPAPGHSNTPRGISCTT